MYIRACAFWNMRILRLYVRAFMLQIHTNMFVYVVFSGLHIESRPSVTSSTTRRLSAVWRSSCVRERARAVRNTLIFERHAFCFTYPGSSLRRYYTWYTYYLFLLCLYHFYFRTNSINSFLLITNTNTITIVFQIFA